MNEHSLAITPSKKGELKSIIFSSLRDVNHFINIIDFAKLPTANSCTILELTLIQMHQYHSMISLNGTNICYKIEKQLIYNLCKNLFCFF